MFELKNSARVLRRMIGKVDIFDMSGSIKGDSVARIREYINAYIKQCQSKFVILNVQEVDFIDNNSVDDVLGPLANVERKVIFYTVDDIKNIFSNAAKQNVNAYCRTDKEVTDVLGEQLLNIKSPIPFKEKRSVPRLTSAIPTDMIYKVKNTNEEIVTSGLITNISEKGAFVEYIDLDSAARINKIDYFKNIEVRLNTNDNNFINQNLSGEIVRVELSGRQTSLAVRFFDDISLASLY